MSSDPKLIKRPVRADGHHFELRIQQIADAHCQLLWLPALGVSGRHYDALGQALAAYGIQLAAVDYRGIGSSSLRASRSEDWSYRNIIEVDLPAAAAVLDPALPLIIGGHSLGGQLAALFAARHPAPRALVWVGAGIPHWRRYGWKALPLLAFGVWVRLLIALYGYYPGRRFGFAGNESGGVMANWVRSIRTGRYRFDDSDYQEDLAQLTLPIISVATARDRLVTRASTHELMARMSGEVIADVVLRPDDFQQVRADHFGWMKEPGPVATVIGDALGNIPRRSGDVPSSSAMDRTGV